METAADRFRFALRFNRTDLESLGPTELEELEFDITQFVREGGSLQDRGGFRLKVMHEAKEVAVGAKFRYAVTKEDMRVLQWVTARILEHALVSWEEEIQLIKAESRYEITRQSGLHIPCEMGLDPIFEAPEERTSGEVYSGGIPMVALASRQEPWIAGSLKEVYGARLLLLIDRNWEQNRIMRCPVCRDFFYREGKMKYCRRSCANRASQRAWRKTRKGKEKRRQQAKRRYQRKVPVVGSD